MSRSQVLKLLLKYLVNLKYSISWWVGGCAQFYESLNQFMTTFKYCSKGFLNYLLLWMCGHLEYQKVNCIQFRCTLGT
jgi:hypothetical protein